MAYIPLEKLLNNSNSLYNLVMAAAKRATELGQGAQPLIQTHSKKISTIALEEIAEGKVTLQGVPLEPGEMTRGKDSEKE